MQTYNNQSDLSITALNLASDTYRVHVDKMWTMWMCGGQNVDDLWICGGGQNVDDVDALCM